MKKKSFVDDKQNKNRTKRGRDTIGGHRPTNRIFLPSEMELLAVESRLWMVPTNPAAAGVSAEIL